ncbi:MAG: hypothetical protein ACI97A_001966 [Planctomycetota bacterium]
MPAAYLERSLSAALAAPEVTAPAEAKYKYAVLTALFHWGPIDLILRVTEPFFTTKKIAKETGISLSMTYELANSQAANF